MGIIKENKLLFDNFLSTNDIKYVDEMLVSSRDTILKSIKSVLKKYGIEEEKADEYFGQVYLDVRERIIAKKEYLNDDFSFYCLFVNWIKKSVVAQICKENEFIDRVVLFEDLRKNKNELNKYSLLKYFNELNEHKFSDREKRIIKNVYDSLLDYQRDIFDMYFGFNGKSCMSRIKIARELNFSKVKVDMVLSKIFRDLRRSLFDEQEKNNFSRLK